ncbi:hypothetical protein SAMN05216266_1053 [Amycolatopsis marina]|uniref:VOC domain-containing protein n=1 Tax=Amycolatopsis marina TaxID=490629 RepID=A0A1I0YEI1_9PSEU|nr:VOC family protein [Amycolatopsis marina]SFB11602.1 hypothetical protein SAMN05216266_1053 [Amycolatopsis marina]
MATRLQNVAFDCADPYGLARFWSQVFDAPAHEDNAPGEDEAEVLLPNGEVLFFQRVPEPRAGKNRVHVCLRPEGTRDEEVERLASLGASLVDDCREPDGTGWVVLGDPEGNEFCVLRGDVERLNR